MAKLIYYKKGDSSLVKEFIDSLDNKQKAKIFRIFQYIEVYGLSAVLPHVKKISGTKLWEIRILGKDNVRVLYVSLDKASILLLHGFIKKAQKAPSREIQIATMRLESWTKNPIEK